MIADLTSWSIATVIVKFLVYLGSFFAIGSGLFILFNPQAHVRLLKALSAIVILGTITAALASLAQFYIQAGALLDEGMTGMFDPEMIELVRNSPMGTSVFVRCLGLLLLLSLALSIPVAKLFGALGAVMTAASFALIGHTTKEPQLLLGLLVTIHVLGVSFWIGALWPLRRVAKGAIPLREAAEMAHRFGKQAVVVVGVLIVAGLLMLYFIASSPAALLKSSYGLILLLKLVLVYALMLRAAANKFKIVPKMLVGDVEEAQLLVRSINREMVLMLFILMTTAIITTTPAPSGL